MAEPTATTTGTLWAIAAGTLGAFFAQIGVPWQAVFFAVLGALFGGPAAGSMGRFRAIAAFPASVMLAAKAGTLMAAMWFSGSVDWAGGLAAVSGIALHPAIAIGLKLLPAFGARVAGVQPEPTSGDAPK